MAIPTKEEKAWFKKLEKLLMNPPSNRIGFYTVGDNRLSAYDKSQEPEIQSYLDSGSYDFCNGVEHLDAALCDVSTEMAIHSTAG